MAPAFSEVVGMAKRFKAKYCGVCACGCGAEINPGDRVEYVLVLSSCNRPGAGNSRPVPPAADPVKAREVRALSPASSLEAERPAADPEPVAGRVYPLSEVAAGNGWVPLPDGSGLEVSVRDVPESEANSVGPGGSRRRPGGARPGASRAPERSSVPPANDRGGWDFDSYLAGDGDGDG